MDVDQRKWQSFRTTVPTLTLTLTLHEPTLNPTHPTNPTVPNPNAIL